MARRVGFYSLRKVAVEMCRLITFFAPIIRSSYPSNSALQAALSAAQSACAELHKQIDLQAPVGV